MIMIIEDAMSNLGIQNISLEKKWKSLTINLRMPLKSSESHQGRDKRSNWGESICSQNMLVLSSREVWMVTNWYRPRRQKVIDLSF